MSPAHTFTDDEVETLLAIFDTVIPAISPEELVKLAPSLTEDVDAETIAAFAAETPSTTPKFRRALTEVLPSMLSPAKMAEFKQALGLLQYVTPYNFF